MKIETIKKPITHRTIQAYMADGTLVFPYEGDGGFYYHEHSNEWVICDWLPYDNPETILFYEGDKITLEF